jgi:hypothetical protein
MALVKNGKYFQLPERSDEDFKTFFGRVAAAGVGRPVDKDGCPQGPWTADLLADAISKLEANRAGIELRTVQLWFESNDKGISATNIRWLARVLGCNDPEGTSAWQAALSAAQSRLSAKRRDLRRGRAGDWEEPDEEEPEAIGSDRSAEWEDSPGRLGLARATEAIFASGSLLNLPAAVFAGAVALQFVSYFLSLHDVTYVRGDGVTKQVGFLWAPNWTILFILFLPLFLAIVVDRLALWKGVHRPRLLHDIDEGDRPEGWLTRVGTSSHSYWAVFLVCVGFAGVVQWVNVRLIPLLHGGGDYAIDWGSLALLRPDQVGLGQQVAFTGTAYLYMCLCFYLLIAGLILLWTLIDDFIVVRTVVVRRLGGSRSHDVDAGGSGIMRGIVRCTIAGLLVAMCMKLQSLYIVTSAPNILDWLTADAASVFRQTGASVAWDDAKTPTSFSSLIVAFLVCAVYVYGVVRIGSNGLDGISLVWSNAAIALLVVTYLLAGVIEGFSLLLGFGLIVATYGLFAPDFGFWRHEGRGRGYVS